jgi:hypothetical protein
MIKIRVQAMSCCPKNVMLDNKEVKKKKKEHHDGDVKIMENLAGHDTRLTT